MLSQITFGDGSFSFSFEFDPGCAAKINALDYEVASRFILLIPAALHYVAINLGLFDDHLVAHGEYTLFFEAEAIYRAHVFKGLKFSES